jgi:hypothetical protein
MLQTSLPHDALPHTFTFIEEKEDATVIFAIQKLFKANEIKQAVQECQLIKNESGQTEKECAEFNKN